MVRITVGLFMIMAALSAVPASAADVEINPPRRVVKAPPPLVTEEMPRVVLSAPPGPDTTIATPLRPEPEVHYGCQRIWRCDSVICEWRRGCWGIYGYMEGPYYTLNLARRQWENHGWPTPARHRYREERYQDR